MPSCYTVWLHVALGKRVSYLAIILALSERQLTDLGDREAHITLQSVPLASAWAVLPPASGEHDMISSPTSDHAVMMMNDEAGREVLEKERAGF